jgi:hypothetical protein
VDICSPPSSFDLFRSCQGKETGSVSAKYPQPLQTLAFCSDIQIAAHLHLLSEFHHCEGRLVLPRNGGVLSIKSLPTTEPLKQAP